MRHILTDLSGLPVGTSGQALVLDEDGKLRWEDYAGDEFCKALRDWGDYLSGDLKWERFS